MVLLTAIVASVSGEAPWYSAGYSIAPTPMIAPCPTIRRGTEWTVPIVPGLVMSDRRCPRSRPGRWSLLLQGAADDVLAGSPGTRAPKSRVVGLLDRGDQQAAGAVGFRHVDGQAEVHVGRLGLRGLAVDDGEAGVDRRDGGDRARTSAKPIRWRNVRDFSASPPRAAQVVVDHDSVVDEQLRGHAEHRGRSVCSARLASMFVITTRRCATQRADHRRRSLPARAQPWASAHRSGRGCRGSSRCRDISRSRRCGRGRRPPWRRVADRASAVGAPAGSRR